MSNVNDFEPPVYQPTSKPPTGSGVRKGRQIKNAGDVYAATRDIHTAAQEHFVVFSLDPRHRVIARRTVGIGPLDSVEVHPREVFRNAIADGAAAVIFAHNHPSGDPTPSIPDLELTVRMGAVGELCGIPMLDHIVVADGGFASITDCVQRGLATYDPELVRRVKLIVADTTAVVLKEEVKEEVKAA